MKDVFGYEIEPSKIEEVIRDCKELGGGDISVEEAVEMINGDIIAQEEADFNWEMEKAEDAMWREAVLSLIENGIKPLIMF